MMKQLKNPPCRNCGQRLRITVYIETDTSTRRRTRFVALCIDCIHLDDGP